MSIQEEITKGASPNSRKSREHDDPKEIQSHPTRRQGAAHGKDGDAHEVEDIEDHASLSLHKETASLFLLDRLTHIAVQGILWQIPLLLAPTPIAIHS